MIKRPLPKILTIFLVVFTFAFLFFGSKAVIADELDDINGQIDQKQAEKQAKEKSLRDSEAAELQAQLNKLPLNEQLDLVEETLSQKTKELDQKAKDIAAKEAEIALKEAELRTLIKLRNSQMLTIYVASRTRTLSVFFSGKTPVEIVRDIIFRNASVKGLVSNLKGIQDQYEELAKVKRS